MRNLYILSIFIYLLTTGCSSSSKLIGSYKLTEELPMKFQKVGVVAMIPSNSARAAIEIEVSEELKEEGIGSIPTFSIFPLAGRVDLIQEMGLTQEDLRDKIKVKVDKNGIDALIIISLLDTRTTERYIEGNSYRVSATYPSSYYPSYGYNYYDYYGYAYNTIYEPGYVTSTTSYFLEINLYDIATEQLIWTGQSRTTDPNDLEIEAQIFAEMLKRELMKQGVLE